MMMMWMMMMFFTTSLLRCSYEYSGSITNWGKKLYSKSRMESVRFTFVNIRFVNLLTYDTKASSKLHSEPSLNKISEQVPCFLLLYS